MHPPVIQETQETSTREVDNKTVEPLRTKAGSLLGGVLKNTVGRMLSAEDLTYYEKTSQYALENTRTGTTSSWVSPASGNSGAITPIRTFKTDKGVFCRDFTQTITVTNQTKQAYATACRHAKGVWILQQ
jgi:surface antigen